MNKNDSAIVRPGKMGTGSIPCWCLTALFLASFSGVIWANEEEPKAERPHPERVATAVRVGSMPVKLDGVLDDEVWQRTPIATGFTQREPDEGKPVTQETAFQVAYDDEALYVGITCYDSHPDSIVAMLTRRDDWEERDWVELQLNPHHDHQTGYWLLVGPSGSIMDGIIYNDDWFDDTWDGVWEVETAIHDRGWSAEYRIPYHVLRFAEQEEYVWGINILRRLVRREEESQWVHVPKGENGWVSYFGHLEGIRGITPPAHFEAIPFGLGRATLGEDDDLFGSVGVDVRYGLTPNISLNATVNPDFGQVEADPAVLNLSVFETHFRERRPFFLEGQSIFNSPGPDIVGIGGPAQLFYSRRVGKRPGRLGLPDYSEEIERPDATTILGAAKVSGKTAGKMSFGLLQAVTANEHAIIEETSVDPVSGEERTARRDFRVEPWTSYLVGRMEQDIQTHSKVGATVTAVNGDGFSSSYVGSVDGTLKWKDNAYRIFTRLSGSSAGTDDGRDEGYEAVAYFSKFSGNFGGQVYVDARSPGFQVNDLGFMNRADRIQAGWHFMAQIHNPWALARRSGFNLNGWKQWNYDGVVLAQGVNFNTWQKLLNYWHVNFGVNRVLGAKNDLETRGGPVMKSPAGIDYWYGFSSDDRKGVSFWFDGNGDRVDGGDSYSRRFGGGIALRPASNVRFEIGPSYSTTKAFAQWVDNVDDDGDDEDDHFVFGQLKNRVLDLTLRGEVAFSTKLTLQGYVQSFVASGDYREFKELERPNSYAFAPYDYQGDNPDFDNRSLRGNLVLRWEYQPGSTIFLVWSQARSFSVDNPLDPDFRPFRGVRRSLTDDGDNIFLVKCNYWLGL
ncbi:MAG: carbohydrate binding family 9 domain-containing protein [Gemmatimonadetes bacterium]|nr:carbohydrate binding family 9 domain-containing protein [Gemmatimonadota bacterium]